MVRRKMFSKCPIALETGRERTKRLKKLREQKARRLANETPEQREARLARQRESFRKRRVFQLSMQATEYAEEVAKKTPAMEDFGDHPAISLDLLLNFNLQDQIIDKIEYEQENESEYEIDSCDETSEGIVKLNSYKVKCFELEAEIAKIMFELDYEINERRPKLEDEMQRIRQKAKLLQEVYDIPI